MLKVTGKQQTIEQAVCWFIWLHEHKVKPGTVEVFERWLASSPQHRDVYAEATAFWVECDQLADKDLPWPTQDELSEDDYDGSYPLPLPASVPVSQPVRIDEQPDKRVAFDSADNVTHLNNEFAQRSVSADLVLSNANSRPAKPTRWLAVAASVCALMLMFSVTAPRIKLWLNSEPELVYSTEIGQMRDESLEDGSKISLSGHSQLSAVFDTKSRRVNLRQGEALFQIAKDTDRPFIVAVGEVQIRAVGTAFNVNRRSGGITVSVLEGVVEVSRVVNSASQDLPDNVSQRLNQGQGLKYSTTQKTWEVQSQPIERIGNWRSGRLAYVNEPLSAVIQDINRYSERKLVIGDHSLNDLSYTGTVFSRDIEQWLEGLQQAFAIRVLPIGDQWVLIRT